MERQQQPNRQSPLPAVLIAALSVRFRVLGRSLDECRLLPPPEVHAALVVLPPRPAVDLDVRAVGRAVGLELGECSWRRVVVLAVRVVLLPARLLCAWPLVATVVDLDKTKMDAVYL